MTTAALKRGDRKSDEVIELNKWALEWWEQQLESSGEGRIARDYLKRREITDETRKTFRLGYAPDSWDALSIAPATKRCDSGSRLNAAVWLLRKKKAARTIAFAAG